MAPKSCFVKADSTFALVGDGGNQDFAIEGTQSNSTTVALPIVWNYRVPPSYLATIMDVQFGQCCELLQHQEAFHGHREQKVDKIIELAELRLPIPSPVSSWRPR